MEFTNGVQIDSWKSSKTSKSFKAFYFDISFWGNLWVLWEKSEVHGALVSHRKAPRTWTAQKAILESPRSILTMLPTCPQLESVHFPPELVTIDSHLVSSPQEELSMQTLTFKVTDSTVQNFTCRMKAKSLIDSSTLGSSVEKQPCLLAFSSEVVRFALKVEFKAAPREVTGTPCSSKVSSWTTIPKINNFITNSTFGQLFLTFFKLNFEILMGGSQIFDLCFRQNDFFCVDRSQIYQNLRLQRSHVSGFIGWTEVQVRNLLFKRRQFGQKRF